MLALWDAGQDRSLSARGLALLEASAPGQPAAELAGWPVGTRDAALLTLHERLFGNAVDGWLKCPACDATIDVAFRTSDVRAPAASVAVVDVDVVGFRVQARLPHSADLIAVEAEADPARAERALFERCVVAAEHDGQPVTAADLPAAAVTAVGTALTAADPQAEILLDLACPECAATTVAPFDIAVQLWARLDHWARAMLAAVDAIAARYGWSEAAILDLTPRRRQAYLDLIASTAR
jgi:hypothetical protein